MSIDGIREIMQRQPFVPFCVRLTSGARVPVNHPQFAVMTRTGRRMVVAKADDSIEIIDVLMIEAIELPAEAA
jgi:hypothetical protein